MSALVIVALPREDDYVNRISSEKAPHMTLLYLGESVPAEEEVKIRLFLEHAVSVWNQGPFMLDVERRGELGNDNADVLFFQRGWSCKRIADFRDTLLQNESIKKAFDAAEQFEGWTPHLTLGYPDTPAKEDTREHPGIRWVEFDRLSLWVADSDGPIFPLTYPDTDLAEVAMSQGQEAIDRVLAHHGIKGMKWGVRKSPKERAAKKTARKDRKFERRAGTVGTFIAVNNGAADHFNAHIKKINDKPEYKDADFTKPSPLRDKYEKEIQALHVEGLTKAAASLGTNASGTRQYDVHVTNDGAWKVITRQVKHADDGEVMIYTVTRDAKGFVTKIEPKPDTLAQSEEFIEDFLKHYGVKGMKWGVRRSVHDKTPKPVTTRQAPNKRVKAKGGRNQPAHPDAIAAAIRKQSAKKSTVDSLSDKELQKLVNRMNLEQQYSRLAKQDLSGKSAPRRFIESHLKKEGKKKLAGLAATAAVA